MFGLLIDRFNLEKAFRFEIDYVDVRSSCAHHTGVLQVSHQLSLPVVGVSSLEDALEAFLNPEVLPTGDANKCTKCGVEGEIVRTLNIIESPNLMCISLVRLDTDLS
jgi:ubiquitin C-terminal hydrolase